ncbi:uncharacterized protein LOC113217910 [Frankliniella occidentalis]|uniref:Uncharacterized protein LOC113217910 n=1 Tax=Frankliniella occidentalis TaxID=133901 RepID=A0A6J1TJV1_FRAOC|nr:uncharacterized protein LOC113217910 [Frankliniella occidentalis]
MIAGSSCSCHRLSLCDLATTLLQAIEANKAQDAETLRKRQEQPEYAPYRSLLGRFRRADAQDADDGSPPNPTLLHITRAYLRRLRDDEHAARQESLRRARETIERSARGDDELQDDLDEDDHFADDLRNLNRDSDPSDAIQRIALHS